MTKQAYIFPGQGAQFVGMGKDLYDQYPLAKEMFEQANEILGFRITDLMFSGTDEDLRETRVTQPAIFLHSVIAAACEEFTNGDLRFTNDDLRFTIDDLRLTNDAAPNGGDENPNRQSSIVNRRLKPDMVAGHSLGEFSALVAAKSLSFEDGLKLVAARANAMQKACEAEPSTMAAILGLDDCVVENICKEITVGATLAVDPPADIHPRPCGTPPPAGENPPFTGHRTPVTVVPANYNSPGQLVISGTIAGIELACQRLKEAGAKRALPLKVGGAFHSPLMQPAAEELKKAIEQTEFKTPICPIYQNVDAKPHTDPAKIKENLILQLTAPVRWTQIVQNMLADGATEFAEFGPGNVLMGLVGKIRGN